MVGSPSPYVTAAIGVSLLLWGPLFAVIFQETLFDILASGGTRAAALTEGYQRASVAAALLGVAAAIVAAILLRRAERPSAGLPVEPVEVPDLVTTDAA